MATKTITLELDAYEKLRAAKRSDKESFSMVVRRAIWPDAPMDGAAILSYLQNRPFHISEEDLDQIEAANRADKVPGNPWGESNR